MLLGVKTTDPMPVQVRRFERWIGRRVDFVTHYTPQGAYENIANTDLGRLDQGMPMDRPLEVSVPLCEDNGSLALTARGAGDWAYATLFRALAAARPGDPEIWIRPGWEFNGDWYPWSAGGKEGDYRAAFRRVVGVGRAVDRRFRFIWGWTYSSNMGDPMRAYPGDDAVDFFGNDVYRHKNYLGCDPVAAWNSQVTRRYGLAYWSDMADRHGKAKTINEFGVNADTCRDCNPDAKPADRAGGCRYDDGAPYVQAAYDWFVRVGVAAVSLWHEPTGYDGVLLAPSGERDPPTPRWPETSGRVKRLFGAG
jgi:glycosyl hydrolase family 26